MSFTNEFREELYNYDFKELDEFGSNMSFCMYLEDLKSEFDIPTYTETVAMYCVWGTNSSYEKVASKLVDKIKKDIESEAKAINLIKCEQSKTLADFI